jgi:hypothetical protein
MGFKHETTAAGPSLTSKITLLVTVLASVYWMLVQIVDIYHFAVLGAIYEILWLPFLLVLHLLPVFSFIMLVREKFRFRSLYLYALLISLMTLFRIHFSQF